MRSWLGFTGSRSFLYAALVTLISVSVTTVFQNCGDDGFKARYYGDLMTREVSYPSPFDDKKVVIDKSYQKTAPHTTFQVKGEVMKSTWFDPGESLVVFVDNICAASHCEEYPDSISCEAYRNGQPHKDLSEQAYTYNLESGMTEYDLTGRVEGNPEGERCLVGITNGAKMFTGGTIQTNDPMAADQPYLDSIGLWDAYDYFHGSRNNNSYIWVAVVDSGSNQNHNDQRAPLLASDYTSSGNNDDCTGHGSFVNGVIGAVHDNDIGIAGVSSGRIRAHVKAFACSGSTDITRVVNAINLASTWICGAQFGVINLSLGGTSGEAALRQSIARALERNCMIVVSAGNDGSDITWSGYFPASLAAEYEGVIAVASTDNEFNISSFSNYSNTVVEVAAPGENIVSFSNVGTGYTFGSGTSYAAPMVTAALSMMAEKLSAAGLMLNPAMAESLFLRGMTRDTGLLDYVKDGRRLDLVALRDYLSGFLEGMNQPQIGLGEPVPQGAGFLIPVSYSRGANDYTIEFVSRNGGDPTVIDFYTIETTYGSLDFFLKDPPVLILDEATSAVDNETEAAIQRSLAAVSKGRTVIIIAHRLSTIVGAKQIFVLEHGRITQTGNHNVLIEQEGAYKNLWNVQTGGSL